MDDLTYWLIENGGDLYVQDNQGKTPFDIAGIAPIFQGELRGFFIFYVVLNPETLCGNELPDPRTWIIQWNRSKKSLQ